MAQAIKAEIRENQGTRDARKLRREGLIPAVIYGHGKEAVPIRLNRRELERAVEHGEHVVSIEIPSQAPRQALIKEVQHDPIGGGILHADFTEVSMDETVRLTVPVVLHGTAAGVREGGTIDLVLHELEIECLAANIPQEITVEVASLGVNEQVTVVDVNLPEGVRTDLPPEELVVACRPAAEEEEEAPAPEEGEVMPEVIAERKEEGAAEAPPKEEG